MNNSIRESEAFFEFWGAILMGSGETDSATYTPYIDNRGIKLVDGYGGDPRESAGVLSLIIGDFLPSETIGLLTNSDIDRLFGCLKFFIQQSLKTSFRKSMSLGDPGYNLADIISTLWSSLKGINLIIITNRRLSTRESGQPAEDFEGVRCTFSVWDIERLRRYEESGHE